MTELSAGAKRPVARLGIEISELGFGAWGIGGKQVGDASGIEGREALLAYLAAGGNFIDTAATYGESEELIGKTLREFGGNAPVYVATKTKCGETADTLSGIRASAEKSLKLLGRDCLDVFYLHFPPEDGAVMDAALGECETLRGEGKIRGIAASIKGPAVTDATVALCKKYVDSGRVDMIQMVYSILRQRNGDAIEYAASKGVSIIARTVMESGFLTGKYGPGARFPDTDHRARWNDSVDAILTAAGELRDKWLPASPYAAPGQLAVKFAMSAPGIASVIVGAKTEGQEKENLRIPRLPPMDGALRDRLIAAYGDFTDKANPTK